VPFAAGRGWSGAARRIGVTWIPDADCDPFCGAETRTTALVPLDDWRGSTLAGAPLDEWRGSTCAAAPFAGTAAL